MKCVCVDNVGSVLGPVWKKESTRPAPCNRPSGSAAGYMVLCWHGRARLLTARENKSELLWHDCNPLGSDRASSCVPLGRMV